MKKVITVAFFLLLFLSLQKPYYTYALGVSLDGNKIPFINQLIDENGIIMAPVKEASESVQASVYWYPGDRHIEISNGQSILNTMVGVQTAYLNDSPITMQAATEVFDGRAFMPLQTIYESLGYTVTWSRNDQTMLISKNNNTLLDTGSKQKKGIGNSSSGSHAISVSAIGDCTLGSDDRFTYTGSFNEMYRRQNGDSSYFFSGVKQVLANDDLTIANLETTLTNATTKADKSFQGNDAYFFKGDPVYVRILQEGSIEAVNIANNHSYDFESQGYLDTLTNLKDAEIGIFGYDQRYITTIKDIRVGLLGYNDLGPLEEGTDITVTKWFLANDIKYLRKQGCSLVIIEFHWGIENRLTPTSRQEELGRFAVDSGADLVIGSHPHIIEPIEKYKGRYIVYSLGNFCFGGNQNPANKDTFIFQQSFSFSNGALSDSQIKVTPCSVSSSTWCNDYRPRILTGSEGNRVLERIPIIDSS